MIRCWLFKIAVVQGLDSGRPLTSGQDRHLSTCVGCRRHYEAQARLVSRLQAGARLHAPEASPFLHGKIMARLREDERNDATAPRLKLWAAFCVVAAVALICAVLLPRMTDHQSVLSVLQPVQPLRPPALSAKLDALNVSQALSKPLENEIQALANDARSALDLVAHNFLPDRTEKARQRMRD